MPRAQAAMNVYRTPQTKAPCLTDLSRDPAFLTKHGIEPTDFKDRTTGFKTALYRSDSDGALILAAQGTVPDQLVDWATNIDSGIGKDTAQYQAMPELSERLSNRGMNFDCAGH